LGVVSAAFLSSWVAPMLYDISPRHPAIYAGAGLVLALAAFAASVIPARRSAAIDPALAIRAE
jgi:ABC-type lipoprotein release transport system permease subunit